MNIFGKLAFTGLALSLSSFASAAISGSTDFRVTLPEILVLYHWDDAHLVLEEVATTAANDSDAREISDPTTRTATEKLGQTSYTINGPAVNTAGSVAFPTSIAVTLKDAWAVRNLSKAAGVNLVLTNPNANLTSIADSTSTVVTSNAALASANAKATGSGAALTITSGFAPVLGDIIFDLNLSNAGSAGEYNTHGAAGAAPDSANATDTFLLTLSAN